MIMYLPDDPHPGGKFGFSYQQLRDDYLRFTLMSDQEFIERLPDVLHFAVFVCFIKEAQTRRVLSDTGIIHELAHLLLEQRNRTRGDQQPEVTTTPLTAIRDLFNQQCCLAA